MRPGQLLLRLDGIADYLVSGGREIRIQRAPSSSDDEVRLFLLGAVLGALLHQRGLLVLHASAIETEHGAVLFAGPCGAGKSTLAAALQMRGYRVLADDICAVDCKAAALDADFRALTVLPAYPQLRLWADALEALGLRSDTLPRVRPQNEKYSLPLGEAFVTGPLPLHAVCLLTSHRTCGFSREPIPGAGKAKALLDSTYQRRFVGGMNLQSSHFELLTAVARVVRIQEITYPRYPCQLDVLVDLVEDDLTHR